MAEEGFARRKKAQDRQRAHLGTTTGARLCPKDQPQRVRMPMGVEIISKQMAAVPRSFSSRFWVVVSSCARRQRARLASQGSGWAWAGLEMPD
jgi:hypothetical protein